MTASNPIHLSKIEGLPAEAINPEPKAMHQSRPKKNQPQLLDSQSPASDSQILQEPENAAQEPLPEEKTETETDSSEKEYSSAIFRAIGVVRGEVNFDEDGRSTVTISRRKYQLLPGKHRSLEALKKEIEATGEHTQKLIVYPKVIHFPKRDQLHKISFQLVGFDQGRNPQGVSGELDDLEFKLSGLWQFIPVCRTPCISIFRNFSRERLEYIKQAEATRKVRFMKASHVPLLWKDAPVRPFRFNPKAGKDQGKPAFVQIKARFLPQRDVFGFMEQLEEPQKTAPKFLKASKKDKAEAQQKKAETRA